MTPGTLVRRSLAWHWRSHLAVAAGVALAAAVLTGSLVTGDSVRASLHHLALARVGRAEVALATDGRAIADGLAARLRTRLAAASDAPEVAPVLQLPGLVATPDGASRAPAVQVLGVDARFWRLSPSAVPVALGPDQVALNRHLAARLAARPGDSVVVRVEKPGLLPRDAPHGSPVDSTVSIRLVVAAVVDDADFGRFSLQASQLPPLSAWLDLGALQRAVELPGSCNLLLAGASAAGLDPQSADRALRAVWRPADAGLELRALPGAVEVRTPRVFLDDPVAEALPGASGVMTYFVNELRVGDLSTPYSLVAGAPWGTTAAGLPGPLAADEVAITTWLAADLKAGVGDTVRLRHWLIAPSGALVEGEAQLRVRHVVPMDSAACDRELMPPFPGISDAEHCRDWDSGLPIDLTRIRAKDEAYWDRYRGTPKAFVDLGTARRLWGNRFGSLTALRVPAADPAAELPAVERRLAEALDPAALGLFFRPLREQALAASAPTVDFGGLFAGLGFFLILAALILAGLLMAFAIARRNREIGLLLAVGIPVRRVGRWLLAESATVAALASLAGSLLGCAYAWAILRVLAGQWRPVVGTSDLQFAARPGSLLIGACASTLIASLALWMALRRAHRRPARALLAERRGGASASAPGWPWRTPAVATLGALAALACLAALAGTRAPSGGGAVLAFAAAGSSALVAALAGADLVLTVVIHRRSALSSLADLAMANATRRRGRSLAVVGVLACAVFLVLAVGAFRRDPLARADERDSGTGGFALFAETTVPLVADLNLAADRAKLGLDPRPEGMAAVAMRVDPGDDASCLNLNRSRAPRLVGVDPRALSSRGAFRFTAAADDAAGSWDLLGPERDGVVPAIADQATATWALGLAPGDQLEYRDERGRAFAVRLVAVLDDSLLQGCLIVDERAFSARYPSQGGHRWFLIDAPAGRAEAVMDELSAALADHGGTVVPAATRLAAFMAVQRVYLDIFQTLGGLALLLGSVGVGAVVLRNVIERRNELALLRAIGFRRRALEFLVMHEHLVLLVAGLGCGAVAGALAVWPLLTAPAAELPWAALAWAVIAILACGIAAIWGAGRWALSATTLEALREE